MPAIRDQIEWNVALCRAVEAASAFYADQEPECLRYVRGGPNCGECSVCRLREALVALVAQKVDSAL